MMKCKSFQCLSDQDFGRIPQWFEDHKGIKVESVTQSQCLIGQRTRCTIVIWYSEPTPPQASIKFKTWASVDDVAMNQWMADKEVKEIVSITQSESPNERCDTAEPSFRIILLYR